MPHLNAPWCLACKTFMAHALLGKTHHKTAIHQLELRGAGMVQGALLDQLLLVRYLYASLQPWYMERCVKCLLARCTYTSMFVYA